MGGGLKLELNMPQAMHHVCTVQGYGCQPILILIDGCQLLSVPTVIQQLWIWLISSHIDSTWLVFRFDTAIDHHVVQIPMILNTSQPASTCRHSLGICV